MSRRQTPSTEVAPASLRTRAARTLRPPPTPLSFEDLIAPALDRLQRSLRRVLEFYPEVSRAVDLRRRLALDAALAWQIFSFATSDDVMRDARLLPKARAMGRFLESASAAGSDDAVLNDAKLAYEEYGGAVRELGGDRASFDAISASLRPPDGSMLVRLRRAAFRANGAIWGVTVRTIVNTVIFRQRETGEHDCLCVRARIGVRGLRPGARIAIHASTRTWGGALPAADERRVTVDGCKLIESACSSPPPILEHRVAPDGSTRDYLMLDGLGRAAEKTVYWSAMSRGFSGGSVAPPHGCTTPILEPAERLIVQLLVPKGWTTPPTADVRITPQDPDGVMASLSSHGEVSVPHLPFEGKVRHAGGAIDALRAAECPGLPEIVGEVLHDAGWRDTAFDVYRCIVRFPVLHSMVHLWADGPTRPEPMVPSKASRKS